ncbi:MAG: nitronate monooxygenase [Dehalococcoidia bacterium]|nr:nitronate monooxygenase [Dehalococcoidia bacterium]
MKTRITELFGIQHPIMCGGMMWLAKPELCAAISNAGGLGNLTAGNYESGSDLGKAIDKTRQLTNKPFCVNVTFMPSVRITKALHEEYFQVCCEQKVAAIEVSGAPLDKYLGPDSVRQANEAGVKLIHKLGSVKHARHAAEVGYDAVIAAGFEEGGHPLDDDVTTMILTPRICESVNVPVISAGGMVDGRSMAAAMVLGAEGIMMASRFIATTECLAHPRIKEELVRRQENDTTLICKTIDLQMRALRNELVSNVLEVEARHGSIEEIIPLMSGERSQKAWENGDVDGAPLAVGQSIGLIKEIVSCRELLDTIVREAEETLANVQRRLQGAVS